jgi:hypothetical protein
MENSMEFNGIFHGNFHGIPWNSMEFHGILWNSMENSMN